MEKMYQLDIRSFVFHIRLINHSLKSFIFYIICKNNLNILFEYNV